MQKSHLSSRQSNGSRNSGFTLIEILVVLFISSFIMAAVFTAYLTQQRTQTAQEQVVEMQQSLRSGLNLMIREIRMAGFDPTGAAGAGITTATQGQLVFTMDLNEDGDVNIADIGENMTFDLGGDATNDGVADAGAASLQRTINIPPPGPQPVQPIANNIVAIEFLYHVEQSNSDPVVYVYARNPSAGQLDDIRAVTISVLVRTSNQDQTATTIQTVLPASAANAPPSANSADSANWVSSGASWTVGNNFRSRLLTTTVTLRNLGL